MSHSWPSDTSLTYHEVLPGGQLSRYSVSTAQFREHLDLFRALGQRRSRVPQISFDDGHGSNIHHAAPLLECFNRTATFFVTVGFIGTRVGYMDWVELRGLLEAGHEVGAHGWSHRFLTECSDAELARELIDAKACLEDRLGRSVTELSLPGGRFDERVLLFASDAGYKTVRSSEPWSHRQVTSSLVLEGRAMVRRDTSLFRLQGLVRQTVMARALVYAEHSVRTNLRNALGPSRYHALWKKASGRQSVHGEGAGGDQASVH